MDTERIPDRSGAVVIRPYSETTEWLTTPRDLVALLNTLRFTDEAYESPFVRECEYLTEPMRILPYSETIDMERRAIMFDKQYAFGVRTIVDCLKEHGAFDFSWLDFVIYVSDCNMSELLSNWKLDVDESCYIVRVDKVSWRDEVSFLLECGLHSIVVNIDDRMIAPCIMPPDIIRLRWAVECIVHAENRKKLPPIDEVWSDIERILRHEGLQREAMEHIIDIRQKVERRYFAPKYRW